MNDANATDTLIPWLWHAPECVAAKHGSRAFYRNALPCTCGLDTAFENVRSMLDPTEPYDITPEGCAAHGEPWCDCDK